MTPIHELSHAVRSRRSDMGITQTGLAKLSGLSRATVSQVEHGTIKDLSLTRAARLCGVLGLAVSVSSPRAMSRRVEGRTLPLELAARTASVSYREPLSADQLRQILTSASFATRQFLPHVRSLLEEASVSLLASVVEQLHEEDGMDRVSAWQHMRELARSMKTGRDIWKRD